MANNKQLKKIKISGFKSFKECELKLGNINLLIGANGAGKSNFILLSRKAFKFQLKMLFPRFI